MTLTTAVVEADHRLETAADKASGALAKHRWHWTLDETNSDRVNFSVYARAVGRSREVVTKMANAYAVVRINPDRDLQTEIQIQQVKQTDRQIVETVAKVTGTSIVNTRQHHREDIDRVRNAVAEVREKDDNFTPEREAEVIKSAASLINAERRARQTAKEVRRRSTPLQVLVVEGDLTRARDALKKALDDADALGDDVDEEFLTMLRDTIERVVSLAKLVQLKLIGTAEIDWDAELQKIGS